MASREDRQTSGEPILHPSIATQELRRPNEDRRKVLFVSDNRDNPNWGGRSTAMALLELLAASDLVPTDSIGDLDSRAEMALTALAALEPLLRNPLLGRLAASGLA